MSAYRKKPVVIEAWQFTEATKNQVFNNITCNCYADFDPDGKPILRIQTLEGEMIARLGDWVIRGVQGEFYPCRDDIFRATYEPLKTQQGAGPVLTINIDNNRAEELEAAVTYGIRRGLSGR